MTHPDISVSRRAVLLSAAALSACGVEQKGPDPPTTVEAAVARAYAIRLTQEAGFTLAAASEINANPRDDRGHLFGVWTLPPVRRSSPRGQPADPAFDHPRYDAVGEIDRMTLKFVKPATPHG